MKKNDELLRDILMDDSNCISIEEAIAKLEKKYGKRVANKKKRAHK